MLAGRLNMADADMVESLLSESEEIGRMLHRLIARLREPKAND